MNELTDLLKFYKQQNTRLWIAVFVLIGTTFFGTLITNILWFKYESQWEYEVSIEQDGEGTNIIGDDNTVNGKGVSDGTESNHYEETEKR